MRFDEREFLKKMEKLTREAISERRVVISDGVSVSVPMDHPLHQMRVLLSERLKSKKKISEETDQKIKKAAKMRVSGKKWKEIDGLYEEDFKRDLGKGRRYHDRFQVWLSVFDLKEKQK